MKRSRVLLPRDSRTSKARLSGADRHGRGKQALPSSSSFASSRFQAVWLKARAVVDALLDGGFPMQKAALRAASHVGGAGLTPMGTAVPRGGRDAPPCCAPGRRAPAYEARRITANVSILASELAQSHVRSHSGAHLRPSDGVRPCGWTIIRLRFCPSSGCVDPRTAAGSDSRAPNEACVCFRPPR
jgi:hypothetical protein